MKVQIDPSNVAFKHKVHVHSSMYVLRIWKCTIYECVYKINKLILQVSGISMYKQTVMVGWPWAQQNNEK